VCGTTLTASIDTSRTGFAATETAIIREGLPSILPGPHSLLVDGATPQAHQALTLASACLKVYPHGASWVRQLQRLKRVG
jgi:hypothetical protein